MAVTRQLRARSDTKLDILIADLTSPYCCYCSVPPSRPGRSTGMKWTTWRPSGTGWSLALMIFSPSPPRTGSQAWGPGLLGGSQSEAGQHCRT